MADTIKLPTPPATSPQLRYAILQHAGVIPSHFDLLFETDPGSLLATWRSAVWPILNVAPLVKVADHRREYLEYEGPISGNRGSVTRIATGYYRLDRPRPDLWRLTFRDYVGLVTLELHKGGRAGQDISGDEQWTARPN